jgi:hypothetical protein
MKPAGKACNDGCPANLAVKEAFFAVTKLGAQARSLGRGILTTVTCTVSCQPDLGHENSASAVYLKVRTPRSFLGLDRPPKKRTRYDLGGG